MSPSQLEENIYNCPFIASADCKQRLECSPIPGYGPENPKFLLLGLNPASRENIWRSCQSVDDLKKRFLKECMDHSKGYGKLIAQLEAVIPEFRIPRTVYLTDIVKCPTNNNAVPTQEMIRKCKEAYWKATLSTLNPQFIIILGGQLVKELASVSISALEVKTRQTEDHSRWLILAAHPSQKSNAAIAKIAQKIAEATRNPSIFATQTPIDLSPEPSRNYASTKIARDSIRTKLTALSYKEQGSKMVKANRTVNIVCSSEVGDSIRVSWRYKEWANDYATIYDYSAGSGPTCIVPLEKLWKSTFISQLKTRKSFEKNNGNWSGLFPVGKEIAQLVLSYKDRWDLL